jgi:hypothetical protein
LSRQTRHWRSRFRGGKPLRIREVALIKSVPVFITVIFACFVTSAADAQPRHAHHRGSHASQDVIVCDQRGCSDRLKPQSRAARAATRYAYAAPVADARQRHTRRHRSHARQDVIVCDQRGCSDRRESRSSATRDVARGANAEASAFDANGNTVVVGGRPAGCPYEFCGCEASRYVFGEIRRELNLASAWARKFPRAEPAPGMAAVRPHHVMILMRHMGGKDWLVHDGNSGNHMTREHVRSISGYVIVDPHGARAASTSQATN